MVENLVNVFSEKIFTHLQIQNKTENIIFAGASFYVMMTLLKIWLSGKTKKQLSRFLSDDESPEPKPRALFIYSQWREYEKLFSIDGSNSVLFHSGIFTEKYKKASANHLDSEKINFINEPDAIQSMNEWVSRHTNGNIQNVFSQSDPDTTMVLLNIFMVNPTWVQSFDAKNTKMEDFYVGGRTLKVEMMNQINVYPMIDMNYSRFIFIPINKNKQYAVIVLPNPGKSLDDVFQHFKLRELPVYYEQSKMEYVDLKLPKFILLGSENLKSTFKHFNVTYLFESINNDFGEFAEPGHFFKTIHQTARVVIDESGGTGSHNTDAISQMNVNITEFYVNQPFLFMIFEQYKRIVLLVSAVRNPNVG
ncbi:Serpin B11 [Thelohanellus kitauei]|uniref:Serpin B11 n=1 Tax=Thelohanellus kitauei TaxID=669202 RepID=A0A0C2NBR6_THEKT|nr:Serpin B11 [Thelohanellus kitauei]